MRYLLILLLVAGCASERPKVTAEEAMFYAEFVQACSKLHPEPGGAFDCMAYGPHEDNQ